MYLFHPELLCFEFDGDIIKIPNIDKNNIDLKLKLNEIFNYKQNTIKQKYIFFEESFFCDNKCVDDYELIKQIINYVGSDNIVIKLHPRNQINRFEKDGVKLWSSSEIPWEIIQMNENFDDKVFLTISSGSILASILYFNENIKSYFLFNCTNVISDMVNNEFIMYLDKLNKNFGANNICIPKNKEDFFKNIRR